MTHHEFTIDPFLTAFIAHYCEGKTADEVARISYLDDLLRRCLEEEADSMNCDECQALVSIERAFDPSNPFARAMTIDQLVFSLAFYVHNPWLRSEATMQAAQWRLVGSLLDAIENTSHRTTPFLDREKRMLRDHVSWGLKRTSQARNPHRRDR